jgi:hypothetical protein
MTMSNWRQREVPDSIQISRFPGGNFAPLVCSHYRRNFLSSVRHSRNAAEPPVFTGLCGATAKLANNCGRRPAPKRAAAARTRNAFDSRQAREYAFAAAFFVFPSAFVAAQVAPLDRAIVAPFNHRGN